MAAILFEKNISCALVGEIKAHHPRHQSNYQHERVVERQRREMERVWENEWKWGFWIFDTVDEKHVGELWMSLEECEMAVSGEMHAPLQLRRSLIEGKTMSRSRLPPFSPVTCCSPTPCWVKTFLQLSVNHSVSVCVEEGLLSISSGPQAGRCLWFHKKSIAIGVALYTSLSSSSPLGLL